MEKIYFGAMALLGAMDASIIAGQVHLAGWNLLIWVGTCSAVFLAWLGYEVGLQRRNNADRDAMDAIYNSLCDMLAIEEASLIRERKGPSRVATFAWAFWWKMLLLFVAVGASVYLPFILLVY